MAELSRQTAVMGEELVANTSTQIAKANRNVLEFMVGAQKALVDEFLFASKEMLDRTQTETHLFAEFISKLAGSHSVKDLKTMSEECSRHQIDFIRRDCDRLFKHGQRMIETTSTLLAGR